MSVCCSSGEMVEGSLPLPSLALPLSSKKSTLGSIDVGDGGAGGDFLAMSLRLFVSKLCRLCTESLMPAGASLRSVPFASGTCRTPSWAGATASDLLSFTPLLRFLNRPKPGTMMLIALNSSRCRQTQEEQPKYQVICRDPASVRATSFTTCMSLIWRGIYNLLYRHSCGTSSDAQTSGRALHKQNDLWPAHVAAHGPIWARVRPNL